MSARSTGSTDATVITTLLTSTRRFPIVCLTSTSGNSIWKRPGRHAARRYRAVWSIDTLSAVVVIWTGSSGSTMPLESGAMGNSIVAPSGRAHAHRDRERITDVNRVGRDRHATLQSSAERDRLQQREDARARSPPPPGAHAARAEESQQRLEVSVLRVHGHFIDGESPEELAARGSLSVGRLAESVAHAPVGRIYTHDLPGFRIDEPRHADVRQRPLRRDLRGARPRHRVAAKDT